MWCGRVGYSHCTATHLSIQEDPSLAATLWVAVRFNLSIGRALPSGVEPAYSLIGSDYVSMTSAERATRGELLGHAQPLSTRRDDELRTGKEASASGPAHGLPPCADD